MNKSSIYNTLILLPFYWLFSGMLMISGGDKPMVAMVIISIIATLCCYGFSTIKVNIKQDKFLWVILAVTAYTIFSYYYHGYSSRGVRAILCAALFLSFFPRQLFSLRFLSVMMAIGSLCSLFMPLYYGEYLNAGRSAWPINAIPHATISASIGLLALSLSITSGKHRTISIFTFVVCTIALLLSQTRGLWLGYFAITGVIFIIKFKGLLAHKKVTLIAIAVVALCGFTLKPVIESRVNSTIDEVNKIAHGDLDTSFGLRLQMWQLTPQLIEGHIIFGQGSEHYKRFNSLYKQGDVSKTLKNFKPAHYHNQYIDKLVKDGVIGLFLLVALLVTPLLSISDKTRVTRYMLSSLVLLYAIAGLTDVPFNHAQTLLLYLLLICTLQATTQTKESYE